MQDSDLSEQKPDFTHPSDSFEPRLRVTKRTWTWAICSTGTQTLVKKAGVYPSLVDTFLDCAEQALIQSLTPFIHPATHRPTLHLAKILPLYKNKILSWTFSQDFKIILCYALLTLTIFQASLVHSSESFFLGFLKKDLLIFPK